MSATATVLTARETIFHFFRSLPVMALSNLMLLGAFEGNFNYIFFAVGLGLFAPLCAVTTNIGFDYIISLFKAGSKYIKYILLTLLVLLLGGIGLIVKGTMDGNIPAYIISGIFVIILTLCGFFGSQNDSMWLIPNGSSCTLFETISETPMLPMNAVPTTWAVMTSFFFAYLFFNAYDIYNRPVPKTADPTSVNARKTRCGVSMFIIVIMLVFVLVGRGVVTNCETIISMPLGVALGSYTGYVWYYFLRSCGMGQFDDIFGISSRLLSREAAGNSAPKVCVPIEDTKP
jgi:hypothetical protein